MVTKKISKNKLKIDISEELKSIKKEKNRIKKDIIKELKINFDSDYWEIAQKISELSELEGYEQCLCSIREDLIDGEFNEE